MVSEWQKQVSAIAETEWEERERERRREWREIVEREVSE